MLAMMEITTLLGLQLTKKKTHLQPTLIIWNVFVLKVCEYFNFYENSRSKQTFAFNLIM